MKKVTFFFLLLATWVLLTWRLDPQDVFVGMGLCLMLAAALGRIYPAQPEHLLEPRRWLWFTLYIPYFIYACIKANLDVAYRVLHPHVPIRPGIVKVHTTLKSDLAKTFLANSITLTPGTMSVDIDGQDLYIHWINVATDDPQKQTERIVRPFERMIKEIFE